MMKKMIIIALAIVAFSCDKTCKTASTDARCKETVPTNEMCQAYFQRWFFNAATNECELKAYSGCSEKGFATRGECETCGCKD
jgi:hypothetical protein